MKKSLFLWNALLLIITFSISSCRTGDNIPTYSGPTVSGELESGWQKSTIRELNQSLNTYLPVPTYLPSDYKIQEVYYISEPNNKPPSTEIILLISEQPVRWADNRYTCRLALSLGWNHAGLGLKMDWAEYIPGIRGRLEVKDGEYRLWWETYGSPKSLGSTLILHASNDFPREEMIKIAASTPAPDDVVATPGGPSYRANGQESGIENPWPPIESTTVTLGGDGNTTEIYYRNYIDTRAGQTRNNIIRAFLPNVLPGSSNQTMELRLETTNIPEGITVNQGDNFIGGDRARRVVTVYKIEIAPQVVSEEYVLQIRVEINGINYGIIPCSIKVQ